MTCRQEPRLSIAVIIPGERVKLKEIWDLWSAMSCAFLCLLGTQGARFVEPVAVFTSWCVVVTNTVVTNTVSKRAFGSSAVLDKVLPLVCPPFGS